ERLDLAALVGAARQHDDGHRRSLLAQPADDLEAVEPWQSKIEDDDVRRVAPHRLQSRIAILDLDDLVALGRQAGAKETPDRRLVVYHQHAQRGTRGHQSPTVLITAASCRGTGSVTVKTAPGRSSRLPASMRPPIASTKPRQMASPRPVLARRRS